MKPFKILQRAGRSPGDPHYASIALLCNFASSFVDTGPSPKTLTPTGSPTITADGYTNASGERGLSAAAHADFNWGTGAFTVDGFAKITSTAALQILYGAIVGANVGPVVFVQSGQIRAFARDGGGAVFADTGLVGSVPTNANFHWEWVRSGNNFYLFVDGVLVSGAVSSASSMGNPSPINLFRDSVTAGRAMVGSSKAFRVTKGVARHTAGFTPPTYPFPEHA